MRRHFPFRIFRSEQENVFVYVTTVVARTREQAMYDFLADKDLGDEAVYAAKGRNDSTPPGGDDWVFQPSTGAWMRTP